MKTIKKRKIQRKTNYKKRLGLLKSEIPRIVVRKTNRYIIVQYIKSKESKDEVILGITSKELLNHGWPKKLQNSLKSIPAAYLTGYLLGKKILKKNEGAILDLGLYRNIKGSRIYAVLNGILDSGIKIKCDKKIFPSQDRIVGKHLKEDIQKAYKQVKEKL